MSSNVASPVHETIVGALLSSLCYLQDLDALEKANAPTGYKPDAIKRDLNKIVAALKLAGIDV